MDSLGHTKESNNNYRNDKTRFYLIYTLMLRSFSWERRHPAGLPPEMAAFPVRNMTYTVLMRKF